MVQTRQSAQAQFYREKLGSELVDEHIAIIGPRNSGRSLLAAALATRFHDAGRGNTVLVTVHDGRKRVTVHEMRGSPEQHTIRIYDGYLPEGPYLNAIRIITTAAL